MAQNVLIAGALFPDVPSISVPDQSNNWHSYVDTSDADATADDILNGKTAYVNGVKLNGSYTPPTFSTQSKTVSPTTSVQTITPDSGYDGLSQVTVNAMPSGSATTPPSTIDGTPTITVSSSGVVTAVVNNAISVTPTVVAGYVASGTAGTVNALGTKTYQLPVYNGALRGA